MSMPLIEYGRKGIVLNDVPVFDAHAHVGLFADIYGPPIERQVEEMDRIGIDKACVSSVEAIYGDFTWGNNEVAHVIERFPNHFVGYCHVSAQFPDLMLAELERCFARQGFIGVKVYQVGTGFDDSLFDPVWAFARERGAPVLAHTWGGELTGLDKAAERFPDVSFMAAHAGSGLTYQSYIEAAQRVANLYLDITYSREHTNMIERFVSEVGADRIIWGTDAECFSMSHQIGKVLFARISDEDKRKILYDTAARLFGLPLIRHV